MTRSGYRTRLFWLTLGLCALAIEHGIAGYGTATAQTPSSAVPEVITDPAQMPKSFKEAPQLSELVQQGQLPPLQERIGEEPLVIKPTNDIGRYGGTWRRGFTGPADGQNIDRIQHNHLLFWDARVQRLVPNIVRGWEVSNGGRTFTFFLRRGMKWSDGHPFTADDILFWFEDVYLHEELVPTKAAWNSIGGQQGVWEKVDDSTFQVKFKQPYYMFLEELASLGVAGHFTRGKEGMGVFAPKHYMRQFHPKYVGQETVDRLTKQAGYDNWVQFFKFKNDPKLNVECPVTTPWMVTSPLNTPQLVLVRNPYYFAVDTEGHQLPYIDKIVMSLAENLEVLNLRAIAGEYDFQARHIDLAKVPVFIENQRRGNYTIRFWRGLHGTDAGFFFNQNYDADPEIRKWLLHKDFRIALSLGIDRDQLNEVYWLGLGDAGSAAPSPESPYSPGAQYRKLHATFNPTQANAILDRLGLEKRDAEGFRLRSDGKTRLVLDITTVGAAFVNWTGIAEMVAEHWAKNLGIKAHVQELERSLRGVRLLNNELQVAVWSNDGSDNPFTYPFHTMAYAPNSAIGTLHGKWWQSGGTQGVKPEGDLLKQLELFDKGKAVPPEERIELGQEILRLLVENVWVMGTVGISPALMGVEIISNKMGNVPQVVPFSTPAQTPGNARPEQFYLKP
ncbi:Periplasmic alpha-galactoside-binding protein [Candidatus Entotheonellaceae bacterium PAL068K]